MIPDCFFTHFLLALSQISPFLQFLLAGEASVLLPPLPAANAPADKARVAAKAAVINFIISSSCVNARLNTIRLG